MREHSRSIIGFVSYTTSHRTLQGSGEPERVVAVSAERGLFNTLQVPPLAGRTFGDGDTLDVAVLGEAFWRRRFGAKPPGEWTIVLDGHARRHRARRFGAPGAASDDR